MALIKCPECGADISDKADSCPKCGNPMSKARNSSSPITNTQTAVRRGHQRSELRQGLGNALAVFSVIAAFPIGMAAGFQAGIWTAVIGCIAGVVIAYR